MSSGHIKAGKTPPITFATIQHVNGSKKFIVKMPTSWRRHYNSINAIIVNHVLIKTFNGLIFCFSLYRRQDVGIFLAGQIPAHLSAIIEKVKVDQNNTDETSSAL